MRRIQEVRGAVRAGRGIMSDGPFIRLYPAVEILRGQRWEVGLRRGGNTRASRSGHSVPDGPFIKPNHSKSKRRYFYDVLADGHQGEWEGRERPPLPVWGGSSGAAGDVGWTSFSAGRRKGHAGRVRSLGSGGEIGRWAHAGFRAGCPKQPAGSRCHPGEWSVRAATTGEVEAQPRRYNFHRKTNDFAKIQADKT